MNRVCTTFFILSCVTTVLCPCYAQAETALPPVFRIGIIGTTTSHVPSFVATLNDPEREAPFSGFQVVAAYPGGMPDNPASWDRVEQYRNEIKSKGVVAYPTIDAMLPHIDGILLTSVDGRCHLEQARPVIAAGKPFFIDKPVAATLIDTIEIFRLAREKQVPVFSSSSLRFSSATQAARQYRAAGRVSGALAWSPSSRNPYNPGLPWYGIHGVEMLFTIMGRGCRSVSMVETTNTDLASGVWKNGDVGTFRGKRNGKSGYGAIFFDNTGGHDAGKYEGDRPLVAEICRFFETGKPPIEPEETLEIMAFMEAAAESVLRGGVAVSLDEIMRRAEATKTCLARIVLASDGSIRLDERPVLLDQLSNEINAIADEPTHIRVIVKVEEGYDPGILNELLKHFGRAVLADFTYPIKCP